MQPGRVIEDRYELEELAGEGGMASVYRARALHNGATVALKILHGSASLSADSTRFMREARVLAGFSHPGIVRFIDHGTTASGTPYLVMEWLRGEDLAARLAREGALPVDHCVRLVKRVAEALASAHAHGVLHRDIKPHNLFLQDHDVDRVKLLDFGVARVSGEAPSITESGVFVGTPAYAAPEQVRGSKQIDARADIFSLGCVLFECLTGKPPFAGDHMMAIVAKILFEVPPPIPELVPSAPSALGELVARMLAKDPALRPQSAREVAAELSANASAATGGRPPIYLDEVSAGLLAPRFSIGGPAGAPELQGERDPRRRAWPGSSARSRARLSPTITARRSLRRGATRR